MESASQWGNYVAYGFVCLFLVILTLAVVRSATMFLALLVLPLTGKRSEHSDATETTAEESIMAESKSINGE